MTAQFYKCQDDYRVCNKTLGNVVTNLTLIEPYSPLSDITGFIIVSYDADGYECNYVVLDGKNYFITDRILLNGNKMNIKLHVDVLMNMDKTKVSVIPARSEFVEESNMYIADNSYLFDSRVQHYNLFFDGDNLDYDHMTIIAGIVGSGGNPTS